MEERYHATTQNRFYPDMSNVNKNITVEAKLISPATWLLEYCTNQGSYLKLSYRRSGQGVRAPEDRVSQNL